MSRRFAEIAFTPSVKNQQTLHGSRAQYARVESSGSSGAELGPAEQAFVQARDGFYMASVSETGWPYIQFRGGPKGFLHVLDDHTLGFADLRGNTQYISTGNLLQNDRVALFLMDYAHQARLKILGHATIHEGTQEAQQGIDRLYLPEKGARPERAIILRVEAYDWNCQQHITPRFTEEELTAILAPVRKRLASLEEENARLRSQIQTRA